MSVDAPTATAGHDLPVDPMLPRPFQIIGTHLDTRDTVTLALEPLDGVPLAHRAGQFTMLHAFGVGEVPISICGDPTRPGPLMHTIRDVGAVTHALVTATPGTTIGVRGPFGTGWDVADGMGGDVVVVTGGIGLAPLRPAILEVVSRRAEYGRVVAALRRALAGGHPVRRGHGRRGPRTTTSSSRSPSTTARRAGPAGSGSSRTSWPAQASTRCTRWRWSAGPR